VKRRLAAYRLTPAGGGLLLVLVAALLVLLLGPRHDEAPAFVVIAVVLAIFAVGAGANSRSSTEEKPK